MNARQEKVTRPEAAHTDGRGTITNLTSTPHVALITSKIGAFRAQHWHPGENIQWMYLLKGSYAAASEEVVDGKLVPGTRQVQIILAGQLAECPPNLAHAYRFLEDSVFLNINSTPRAPDGYGTHTIPIEIEPPTGPEVNAARQRQGLL